MTVKALVFASPVLNFSYCSLCFGIIYLLLFIIIFLVGISGHIVCQAGAEKNGFFVDFFLPIKVENVGV